MYSTRPTADSVELIGVLSCLDFRAGDLGRFLGGIAAGFSDVLGVDWTVVTVLDSSGRCAVLGDSVDGPAGSKVLVDLHDTVTERVVEAGAPLRVADSGLSPDAGAMPVGFLAYLGVPLKNAAGDTIGTLCSFNRAQRAFTEQDVVVAEVFAARAAAAIDHHLVHGKLEALKDGLAAQLAEKTAELYRAQNRLIQRERLAAIGELSAKIVHELRSPISTVTLVLDHLRCLDLPVSTVGRLDLALREIRRMNGLLGEVLDYSRPVAGRKERVAVDAVVTALLAERKDVAGDRFRSALIRYQPATEGHSVLADPDKLRQVIINLLENACDASPPGFEIDVETGTTGEEDSVFLRVRNRTMQGTIDTTRAREPFFSTKAHGTGLGLAIVDGIVDALRGDFSLIQGSSGEVVATVTLPVAPEAAKPDIPCPKPRVTGRSDRE